MVDKSIVYNEDDETFDIGYDTDGDCLKDSLDTQIYMAIFGESRANKSEISVAEKRRGFLGEVLGYPSGSKVWLDNGLKTNENLNRIVDYARKSLQFLKDDSIVKNIDVEGEFIDLGIALTITSTLPNNVSKIKRIEL